MAKCKFINHFFLTTLGFKKTNDRALNVLISTSKGKMTSKSGKWGKHPTINQYKYGTLVMEHIKSFSTTILHYDREYTLNVCYSSNDITKTLTHQHFIGKCIESGNYVSNNY